MTLFGFSISPTALAILMLVGLVLLVVGARKICGAFSTIPRSIYICFGILFVYIISIALMQDYAAGYEMMVSALPFGEQIKAGDFADLFNLFNASTMSFSAFFSQAVQIFYISVLVNLIESFFHGFDKKKKVKGAAFWLDFFFWYFKECIIVFAVMLVNLGIKLGLQKLGEKMNWPYTEDVFNWFLIILFVAMAVLLVVITFMKLFKAAVFAAVPVLGVFLTFFSENRLGKSIISSFMSTGIIICLVSILNQMNVNMGGKISSFVAGAQGTMIGAFTLLALLLVWFVVFILWKAMDK